MKMKIILEPKLLELINQFFPKMEAQRIKNYLRAGGNIERKGQEYRMTMRALLKLKRAQKILKYEQVQDVMIDHRGRKKKDDE